MKGGAANRGAAYRGAANRGAAYRGAARRILALATLSLGVALSACHGAPPKQTPVAPAESIVPPVEIPPPSVSVTDSPGSNAEATKAESAEPATCSCSDSTPKPVFKRKPKPVVRTPPPNPPVVAPAPTASGEASVKLVDSPSASILGKKVRAQDGEDLGRVVDILADGQGRIRAAVIEFGGFLGVGNRRIAVDWSLLKFHAGDADTPVTVDASRAKLQATPEYKGTERPLALMAPAAAEAPAAPAATSK